MFLIPVDPKELDKWWPSIKEGLKQALESGIDDVGIETIYDDVKEGHRQLWLIQDSKAVYAVGTTFIINYPKHKVGVIDLIYGVERNRWGPLIRPINHWFQAKGCKYVEVRGREGWERILEKEGFLKESIILRKELLW